jgi:hypothetical protein
MSAPWLSSEQSLLLALHTQEDASSPLFWQRIAAKLNRPGKDAAECQRQWQELSNVASPVQTNKRKRAAGVSAKSQGAAEAATPKQQQGRKRARVRGGGGADEADSVPGSATSRVSAAGGAGADVASPAAAADRLVPRARVQKPTLRQLFEQHHAASALAASASSSAANDDDDFFEASPLKAGQRQQPPSADKLASNSPASTLAISIGSSPQPVVSRSRKAKSAAAGAVTSKRALLAQLRSAADVDQHDDEDDAGTEEDNDNDAAAHPTALLSSLPARDKTDAYVRVFQRTSKLSSALAGLGGASKAKPNAPGAAAGAGRRTRGAGPTAAQPASFTTAPMVPLLSSAQSALRAALRERDARAQRRLDRAQDQEEEEDEHEDAAVAAVESAGGSRTWGVGVGEESDAD